MSRAKLGGNTASFTIPARGGMIPVVIPGAGEEPVFTLIVPPGAVPGDVSATATLVSLDGRLEVRFSPELVFDPSRTVVLSTRRERAAIFALEKTGVPPSDPRWTSLAILTDENGILSDDGQTTHIDGRFGLAWRRILHFSGYNITASGSCDPTQDPTCTATGSVDVTVSGS